MEKKIAHSLMTRGRPFITSATKLCVVCHFLSEKSHQGPGSKEERRRANCEL